MKHYEPLLTFSNEGEEHKKRISIFNLTHNNTHLISKLHIAVFSQFSARGRPLLRSSDKGKMQN